MDGEHTLTHTHSLNRRSLGPSACRIKMSPSRSRCPVIYRLIIKQLGSRRRPASDRMREPAPAKIYAPYPRRIHRSSNRVIHRDSSFVCVCVSISGGPVGLLVVLPEPVPGPPRPASDCHPERRTLRRTAHAHRIHVQGRGERAVLSAAGAAQDRRIIEGEASANNICSYLIKLSEFVHFWYDEYLGLLPSKCIIILTGRNLTGVVYR